MSNHCVKSYSNKPFDGQLFTHFDGMGTSNTVASILKHEMSYQFFLFSSAFHTYNCALMEIFLLLASEKFSCIPCSSARLLSLSLSSTNNKRKNVNVYQLYRLESA